MASWKKSNLKNKADGLEWLQTTRVYWKWRCGLAVRLLLWKMVTIFT